MRTLPRVLGLLALVLGLSAGAEALPSAWGTSAMEKVRPQTAPGPDTAVRLFAARNEFVSFQVGLHGGDTGWRGVSASLPALDGPQRIEGSDLVLYRETLLLISHPTLPYSDVGWWPDGLIPDVDETVGEKRRAFPLDVPAHESRALWVDVHVPRDAPPGDYHGTVEVVGEGTRARVDVVLTVVDWVMPSTSSLRTSFLLWTPSVCKAFTGQRECSREDQLRLLSAFQKLGLEHRLTINSRFDPQAAPDWSTFDTGWMPFLTGTAPLRLPGARMTSVQFSGFYTPEWLADVEAQSEARGLLPLVYTYVADEPPWHSTFEQVAANAQLARRVAPRVPTLLTLSLAKADQHGLTDLIDILVVMVNFIDEGTPRTESLDWQRSRYEAFHSRPARELWLYNSCVSFGCGGFLPENVPGQGWPTYIVDTPASKARAMEWITFQLGATGELYYEVAEKLPSAWTDQLNHSGNGDGTLFYPGTPDVIGGTTGVPLPSIRLKLIRQGLQDYEWLQQVSTAGDSSFAREVAQGVVPAPWRVPDDGRIFELARLRLLQRALTLTGAEVPASLLTYLGEHPGPPPRTAMPPVLMDR